MRSGGIRWRRVLEDAEPASGSHGSWSQPFPATVTVEFTGGAIAVDPDPPSPVQDPPSMIPIEAARDFAEQLAEQRFLELIETHSFETCTVQRCRLCAELSKAKEMGIIAARDNLVDKFWEKVVLARREMTWQEHSPDGLQNRIRKKLRELREIDPSELW